MQSVQAYIADQQRTLTLHPFFVRLRRNAPLREILPFVSHLSFWAMSFQDVLRLNEARVRDPALRRIARHHRAEDSGHDKWFLNDLLKIEGRNPDIRTLFSASHAAVRDASYALVGEALGAASDAERIALLLALESTGHVFFGAVAGWLERVGVTQCLQYFSRHHIDVEKSHEVFEHQMCAFLDSIELSAESRAACHALVDRVYVAFGAIFDHFEQLCRTEASRPSADSHLLAERLLSHELHEEAAGMHS